MSSTIRHSAWPYTPSLAGSVIFNLLFISLTAAICWRIWRTKARFCIVFAVGGLFECIGYIARAAAHSKTERLMPYIIQNFFILVAPALFAASIYMTLGRVMQSLHAEHHSLVNFRWLTKLFVGGDILSFLVQACAAPLMVVANQKYMKVGEGVIIAGLFIQVIMFGLFIVTSVVFERRIDQHPTLISKSQNKWRQIMRMLYGVSALIMARSIFRVVEYIMGYGGYLLQHEWPLYIFDATLMAGVMAVFIGRFPGDLAVSLRMVSPEDDKVQLGRETHVMGRK